LSVKELPPGTTPESLLALIREHAETLDYLLQYGARWYTDGTGGTWVLMRSAASKVREARETAGLVLG
jgi:hypothetical protein